MKNKDLKVDVAILGAGTAGLAALAQVKKAKKKFVLIDPGPLGTTCARVGCMPSKVLLQVASDFARRKRLASQGVQGGENLKLDGKKMLEHVRSMRDHFTKGPEEKTLSLGAHFINERGVFEEPGVLRAGAKKIVAKSVVLATGSHPIVPNSWQGLNVLTSDTLFEIENLPKSLAVFGLGPLGAELGQALAQLGVKVHGYNLDDRILGLTDPKLTQLARGILDEDMKTLFGKTQVEASGGKIKIEAKGEAPVVVEKLLASLGRKPNLKGLGLESIGVLFDEKGIPKYNAKTLKLKKHSIFIAGDVRAWRSVLHEAQNAGYFAGRAACGKKVAYAETVPLAICFTAPGAASVGMRFSELKSFQTGSADFSDQGRAKIIGENKGALHVYASKRGGQLLGAEMICPGAEHLAHILALAITKKMTAKQLLRMPFYHPTLEEGLRTALRQIRS